MSLIGQFASRCLASTQLKSRSANILGYLEQGDPAGSQVFAQLTEQAASQCPDTQIVLSGYRYDVSTSIYDTQLIAIAVKERNSSTTALR